MSAEFNSNLFSTKMDKTIQSFKKISTLRTGRANPNMLDTIELMSMVLMPIEQLATTAFLKLINIYSSLG